MEKKEQGLTRRDFIRAGTSAMAFGIMGLPILDKIAAGTTAQSRVILVRDKAILDDKRIIREDVLENMLDQGIQALTQTSDPLTGWKSMFKAEDVVGVKSNVWRRLSTPSSLESLIVQRLTQSGIKPENIAVDDRGVRNNPVFNRSTALINVRPLRAHDWSGLGTLIKNYIMFAPRPPEYHGNACENLGAIWHRPEVKDKTRLNILVMLTPLFHSFGPHSFGIQYTWNYNGLIISHDPVAADTVGARIIQAKRDLYFGEHRPIRPPLHHIKAADVQFKLGNSQPDRIQVVPLGWQEDILIG